MFNRFFCNFVCIWFQCIYLQLPSSAINEMIDETFEEASSDKPDNLTGPRCRARFDFEGEGHGDLVFEAGDIIQLLAHCGSDWLKGQLEEKTGIFPASFVEIIEDLPKDMENTAADSRNRETTALFDFEGEHGELSFQVLNIYPFIHKCIKRFCACSHFCSLVLYSHMHVHARAHTHPNVHQFLSL